MRRLALLAALLAAGGATLVTSGAPADDSHRYRIEVFDAFGIVEGSEVRVSGVTTGTVTAIEVTAEKRAALTVELSGPLGVFGDRTRCSTEPQSLIAEYFIDCDPRGAPLPEGGMIPAERVEQTVQLDLATGGLRGPFRDRLALIVNELGTGLAGNPDDLNAAIRLGFPALSELRDVTGILARQRRALARMNAGADRLLARLAQRSGDVVSTIREARDTAAIAAGRGSELSRGLDLLDDFIVSLRPTLAELGETARAGAPLLADLRAAAPSLTRLAILLPGFSGAAERAVVSLGKAARPGRKALRRGRDEIRLLRKAGRHAPTDAEILADLLRDLDDTGRIVEIDERAAQSCDDPTRTCYSTGRDAPTGYTGLEGLLNYTYYQAGALNQFDSIGHILQFNVYDFGASPCGSFNAGPTAPKLGGGETTSLLEADPCVSWIGPNQPGINQDLGLPPYDDSVCPNGSTHPEICDPNVSTDSSAQTQAPGAAPVPGYELPVPDPPGTPGAPEGAGQPGLGGGAPGGGPAPPSLDDILDLPGLGIDGLPGVAKGAGGNDDATQDLLDFLFES
jgi:ABC-type transporter Mla subunit MlaD